MDTLCRIEMLGGLRVQQGDRVITRFRAYPYGALLAYLTYHKQPHPREMLIDLLWPECDPNAGRNRLSVALWSLRRQLEPPGVPAGAVITADRTSVRLNPAAVTSDVAELEAALDAAERARDMSEREQFLVQAVELYRGPLLPGYYEEWIPREQERLASRYLHALRHLTAHAKQQGDLQRALHLAHRAVAADPLREETRQDLMGLYAAMGQPSSALNQYRELERILKEELDEEPSTATRAFAEEIRCAGAQVFSASGADESLPPPSPPHSAASAPASLPVPTQMEAGGHAPERSTLPPAETGYPANLPLQLTRFFGRESELAQLQQMLLSEQIRLITLIGPGGSGKTRLALKVAEQLVAPLRGGVRFVPLADLSDPSLIAGAVREALSLPPSPHGDPLEQIVEALSQQPCLLVLDNFEHLAAEGAPLVRTLLERAPALQCLVTSRQALNLEGERQFAVPPLPTPGSGVQVGPAPSPERLDARTPERLMQFASVQLFVDRAQEVRPDFQVTRANAGAVAALCDRVEGIPLAIELAAARTPVLTPAQILAQLERRFDFLVSRRRDAIARHRTLRAAIDWGYHLLAPELQQFFARLSVFRGGWTLEAASAVLDSRFSFLDLEVPTQPPAIPNPKSKIPNPKVLDYLTQLRECSFIVAEEVASGMRFRMLETLREYGQEQLSPEDWADLERRHAAYYLALAERAKPELMGPQQVTWFARLEAELDNFRAVTDWSMEAREPEIGLGLAGALWWFLDIQCYLTEWRERLERLLAMPEVAAPTAMRAGGLSGAAGLAFDQGDYAAARAYREEALPIYIRSGDRWRIALSYFHLGRVVGTQGDYAAARALYEESMAVCRSLGASDPGGRALIANSLYCLAVEARQQGEYERARALCEEALEIRRAVGSRRGLAITLNELGRMRCHQGEYGAARALIEESLAMGRETGDQRVIAGASNNLGRVLLGLGEHAAARAVLTESLAAHRGLYRETWHRRGFAECLEGWALLAAAGNRPERAARLFGAANSLREGQGVPLLPADRAEFEPSMAALQAALGQAVFTAAWEAGYALTWEQAVHEALQGEDDTQNC